MKNLSPRTAAAILLGLCALGATAALGTPVFVLVLGAIVGLTYGLLAICLVLVFRICGLVNFAQPAIGVFALSCMPALLQVLGVPWWIAFAIVVPVGFVTGALINFLVARRLHDAPRVVGVIASLGTAGVLATCGESLRTIGGPTSLPDPPGIPQLTFGPLVVTPGYVALIVITPLMLLGLVWFLRWTRFGPAVLAAASNGENAQLSGISPALTSGLVWGIAGAVSTVATVLFSGTAPSSISTSAFSLSSLVPALAAAAAAGFRYLPRAVVAGIFVGAVQQATLWNPDTQRYADLVMLGMVFIAVLLSRRVHGRLEPLGSWAAVAPWRELPRELTRLWPVRNLGRIVIVAGIGGCVWSALRSDEAARSWTTVACIIVLTLGVALMVSLTGEMSLGHFGVASLAAGTSYAVSHRTGNFLLAAAAAITVAIAAAIAVGLPGLRSKGLTTTIVSLAFGIAVPTAFLADPSIMGTATVSPRQPIIGPITLRLGSPYFLFTALIAVLVTYPAWNVWRGGFGRQIHAARDNDAAAEAFGVRVARTKLLLFAVSGAMAGTAGVLLIHSHAGIGAGGLPIDLNIRVVLAAVVGGLGALYGGPLGALWLFVAGVGGASQATENPSGAGALVVYSSALILILVAPGGAAQLLVPVRDVVAVAIARLYGVRVSLAYVRGTRTLATEGDAPPAGGDHLDQPEHPEQSDHRATPPASLHALPHLTRWPEHRSAAGAEPILQCEGLSLRYGAIRAVDDMDLAVAPREVLGLIGPNGAGKTSMFEMIGGAMRPTTGRILLAGHDITRDAPHQRARHGLVRSFQDARLFPTMNAHEVVMLALERQLPTHTASSILGVDLTARTRARVAHEVLDFFSLSAYSESKISELSTGTRRFVEIAALLSMQPRLLLLDEPSSGIAQRESEQLGPLLRRIRDEFDMAMVVIEHDIPLVMSVSDRIVAMAQGRLLSEGAPEQVRSDDRVVDAYLGVSSAAIERSAPARYIPPTTD